MHYYCNEMYELKKLGNEWNKYNKQTMYTKGKKKVCASKIQSNQ